ncbi:MAG: hypothetical protein CL609_11260 [Anaerolineaceae bacterium]|nr:hypothetical protein [Anaerolineaceae bacterium]
MKTSLQNSVRNGVVFGVVIVFLALIGFLVIAASLLQKMVGNPVGLTSMPSAASLLVFLGFLHLWNGWRVSHNKEDIDTNVPLKTRILRGLTAGVTTGLFLLVYALVVGTINERGVDMRVYLSMLSSQSIDFFLFNQSPLVGGLIQFGFSAAAAVVGAVLAKFADSGKDKVKSIQKAAVAWSDKSWLGKVKTNPYVSYVLIGVVLLLLVLVPRQWGAYWNYIMGTVGIYVLLGLGLNIIVGLSGQLVLGYVAFFAIGAYSFALVTAPDPHNLQFNFWIALVIAVLVSALSGVLIGLPILRLRGDYLAIVTLGFGEIIRILLKSDWLKDFTLGPRGLRNIAGPTLFGREFIGDIDFMYLIILAVLLALFIARRVQDSTVGRAWLAISQDETVAQATGVDTYKYKLLALAIGAAFAGLGGALFASRNQFTGPEDHVLMVSINVLCLVIVGGMGSIPGVVLGAFALKGLPEILRELESYRLLVFGALLVVMMILRPEGLWPAKRPNLEVKQPPPEPETDTRPAAIGGGS